MNSIQHIKKNVLYYHFSHNFTTLLLHNFTSKECRNFSFPSLPSTSLRMTKVEKFLSKKWNRLPLGFGETYFILTTPIAISYLASTTPRLQNSKIFLFLPSFDSAQDDKGGKISFTLSTQLLDSHISHLTCWGSYIINFTILRLHDFTILRLHDFTNSRFTNSQFTIPQIHNSQFTIHSWHLALLQIKNSLADTRESYIEVYHRKN